MTDPNLTTGGLASVNGIDAAPRAVTAFFDTADAAEKAKQDLIAAGVPLADIRVAGGASSTAEPAHPHGFWESLKDFFMPEADRHLYAEGLRRGGFAVSVETDSAAYGQVIDLLDRDGAVDMEERSAGWRDEGWTGSTDASDWAAEERAFTPPGGGTAGFGASMADQPLATLPHTTGELEPGLVTDLTKDEMRAQAGAPDTTYAEGAPGLGDIGRDATARPGQTQPAPAAARDLSHGRTRVRSYVSSDPRDDLDL